MTAQSGSRQVSYIYCMAFYDMLQNLSVIQLMIREASANQKFKELTKGNRKFQNVLILNFLFIFLIHVFVFV